MARRAHKSTLRDPSHLPGTFGSRVFVGGSYKAARTNELLTPRELIEQLKEVVRKEGLHPIVADEFEVDDPDRNIHHDAIWLLSACRTAIFDMTEFSGALMEIERTAEFGTRCLILFHDPLKEGLRLSRMLTSFVREHDHRMDLYGYDQTEEASNAARNWLLTMLRRSHAAI